MFNFQRYFQIQTQADAGGGTGQQAQHAADAAAGAQQGQQQTQTVQQTVQLMPELADLLKKQGVDAVADPITALNRLFEHNKQVVGERNKEAQSWREKAQAADKQALGAFLTELTGLENVPANVKDQLKQYVQRGHGMSQMVDMLQSLGMIPENAATLLRTGDPSQLQQMLQTIQFMQGLGLSVAPQQGAQFLQQSQAQQNPLAALLGGQQQAAQQQQGQQFSLEQIVTAVVQQISKGGGLGADIGAGGVDLGSQIPPPGKLFEMYGSGTKGDPQTGAMFGQVKREPMNKI